MDVPSEPAPLEPERPQARGVVSAERPSRRLPSPLVLQALRFEALVRHLDGVARRLGTPFVLLKGGALHALKVVARDERPMGDLDILLEPGDAEGLFEVLRTDGWASTELPADGDHLPKLMHRMWPPVELHHQVEGIRVGGASPARFADLKRADLLRPLPDSGPMVLVPTRELLAAHAIAHGFIHHKDVAPFYPLRRVFDDLRALGILERTDEEFADGPGRWISEELSREEVRTVFRLARRLARGEDVPAGDGSPEARLLEHVRRSEGDVDYRDASRLRNFYRLAGAGPNPVRTWLAKARTVVFINRYQVDVLYGRPKHEWGYLVRQVLRPFDLAVRVVRYAWAWARLRLRERTLAGPGR